jgi:sRNA-binding regulator protein Hfq
MSMGDYLRLQRAKKGGVTPWEIEAATHLDKGLYRQIEQRYRAVGNDESIEILAEFYGVPFEDLRWRLDWPRKELSRALVTVIKSGEPLTVWLWNGQSLTGRVRWWDLGAFLLDVSGQGEVIVQRHAVERWDPRAAEMTPEELAAEQGEADEDGEGLAAADDGADAEDGQ